MTTEILRNAILENPGTSCHDVEYVVFDEVHYLDDAERGTVWEESLIFAPPSDALHLRCRPPWPEHPRARQVDRQIRLAAPGGDRVSVGGPCP
jgi:hypothetical protein